MHTPTPSLSSSLLFTIIPTFNTFFSSSSLFNNFLSHFKEEIHIIFFEPSQRIYPLGEWIFLKANFFLTTQIRNEDCIRKLIQKKYKFYEKCLNDLEIKMGHSKFKKVYICQIDTNNRVKSTSIKWHCYWILRISKRLVKWK